MNAFIYVMFFSKNSDMLEIENSLLNSTIIIPRYGFRFRCSDLSDKPHDHDHRILGQFVNKPGKRLLCDRAPLRS